MRSGFYKREVLDRLLVKSFYYSCSYERNTTRYHSKILEDILLKSPYSGAISESFIIINILPKLNISLEKFKDMYLAAEKLCN